MFIVRTLATAVAALAVSLVFATSASAGTCACSTAIDGHVFVGMPYYDPSPATDSAVEYWWELSARSDYRSLPPVLSVSAIMTITGTVPE